MSRKLFSNLPSVSELMDHPRLKQMTERVSNNTVVTGVSSYLNTLRIKARRAAADIPVVVGFGIKTPEGAADIARVADGAVVGSAIVERIARGDTPREVLDFVSTLAKGAHSV